MTSSLRPASAACSWPCPVHCCISGTRPASALGPKTSWSPGWIVDDLYGLWSLRLDSRWFSQQIKSAPRAEPKTKACVQEIHQGSRTRGQVCRTQPGGEVSVRLLCGVGHQDEQPSWVPGTFWPAGRHQGCHPKPPMGTSRHPLASFPFGQGHRHAGGMV